MYIHTKFKERTVCSKRTTKRTDERKREREIEKNLKEQGDNYRFKIKRLQKNERSPTEWQGGRQEEKKNSEQGKENEEPDFEKKASKLWRIL